MIVYVIRCTVNDKRYVGMTRFSAARRFLGHCRSANNGSRHAFHSALRCHGIDKFVIEEFYECVSRVEAAQLEIEKILEYRSHVSTNCGYNMTSGGEGIVGLCQESLLASAHKHRRENLSAATLQKMRHAKLGRQLSDETKQKMREAHRGKVFSGEHRRKIGHANSGENCSLETREKLSRAKSRRVMQMTFDGVHLQTFDSIKAAAAVTGVHASNISRCCLGHASHARGFLWKFEAK